MNRLLIMFMMGFFLVACSTIKEIPIQNTERIEYRDSVIVVKEFVEVEIPTEKIVYVGVSDTTSVLTTSLSRSEAKIDNGVLTHTLEQKGTLTAKIDTFFIVEYVDRVVEREIPITVEVDKPFIPNWMWWIFIYAVVFTLLLVGYIVIKIRT